MNRETVTIKRYVQDGTDAYGNETFTETYITVKALVADNHSKTVSEASREPSDALCTLYVSGNLQINPTDRFEVRGVEWLYMGLEDWRNPFGGLDGLVVHLRRRSG